jgi:hypothetical protein
MLFIRGVETMPVFIIVDLDGCICWLELNDGTYVVDPLFLEEFKEFYTI